MDEISVGFIEKAKTSDVRARLVEYHGRPHALAQLSVGKTETCFRCAASRRPH